MSKWSSRQLATAAIIAALYTVMSLMSSVFGLTYGAIQCRFSEALTVRQLRFCGSLRRGEARRLHSRHGLCVIYASKFDFHGYPFFFRGFGSGVTRSSTASTAVARSVSSISRI